MTFFQGRHTDGQQACDKMLGVTNQNRYEIPPTAVRLAVINKTQDKTKQKSAGEDVEKKAPRAPLVRRLLWPANPDLTVTWPHGPLRVLASRPGPDPTHRSPAPAGILGSRVVCRLCRTTALIGPQPTGKGDTGSD